MKAAFVLGLAVAANAQVDNEFAGYTPVNYNTQSLNNFKSSLPVVHRTPIDYNTKYLNQYGLKHDDVADDELVQTFYSPSGADLVKYAKQSQQTVYRPTAHVVRDDADDELLSLSGADLVKYAKQSQQTVYRPTAHVVRDDADDELVGYNPSGADLVKNAGWSQSHPSGVRRPVDYNTQYLNKYGKKDDSNDDELVQTFYSPSGADLVKYAKQSQQTVYRPTAHVVSRDDAADDELVQTFYSPSGADLVKYAKQSQQTVYRPTAHVVRDDADDELVGYNPSGADLVKNAGWSQSHPSGVRRPVDYNTQYLNKYGKKDDSNDDELVQTFYSPSGADLVKYAKQSQQTVYRPTAHVVSRDDAADDELVQTFYSPSGADLVKYAKQSQQTVYRPTAHVVRDDEADDELAYLAHLIKETKTQEKPEIRRFRHADKN